MKTYRATTTYIENGHTIEYVADATLDHEGPMSLEEAFRIGMYTYQQIITEAPSGARVVFVGVSIVELAAGAAPVKPWHVTTPGGDA